jgi:hypothetical protein
MSSVSFIASTQASTAATNAKPTAQQAIAQTQSATSSNSSVNISSSALHANYEQTIAEKTQGQNVLIQAAFSDPKNVGADMAYGMSHDNSMTGSPVGGLVSIAGKTPNDAISYSNGEPVTVASQAYFTKQYASYQNQVLQLYNTEKTNGTNPGQIVSDIFDLQAKQPDAFRAMMNWPPLAGSTSIQMASNPNGAPEQYLNSGGQIVKS